MNNLRTIPGALWCRSDSRWDLWWPEPLLRSSSSSRIQNLCICLWSSLASPEYSTDNIVKHARRQYRQYCFVWPTGHD